MDRGLGGEGRIGGAGGAVGGGAGLIHHHVEAVDHHIADIIAGEDAHRAGHDHGARISARFVSQISLGRGDVTVLPRADFHLDIGPWSRPRAFEDVFARHHDLDRLSALFRQQRGHGLEIDRNLPAEPAADLHRRDLHTRDGQVQNAGGGIAHHERALRAAPDVDATVVVPERRGVVRLNISLVDRGRVVFALHDHIGFGKSLFDIAQSKAKVIGDIADLVRLLTQFLRLEIVMEDRRALPHGVGSGHDARQDFIVHFNQAGGIFGVMRAHRRYGGDGVALVESPAGGQNIVAEVPERGRAFTEIDDAIRAFGQVGGGDHRSHARKRGGLAGVDAQDPRVRMGTAQDKAVQQSGGCVIGAILSAARHLVGAIVTNRPRAYHCVRFHAFTSCISAAACLTARKILS